MGKRGPVAGTKPSRQTPVFSMRLHPQLRQALEAIADQNRRSLADEISRRLTESLEYDRKIEDAFGSEKNFFLMKLATVPMKRQADWLDDQEQFDRCVHSIISLFENVRPGGPRTHREIASAFALHGDMGLFADALWGIVRAADSSTPREQRSEIEHLAINVREKLGKIAERADPFARSREIALQRLIEVFPDEDFEGVSDEDLFDRVEKLQLNDDERWEKFKSAYTPK